MTSSEKRAQHIATESADTGRTAHQSSSTNRRVPWTRQVFLALAVLFALCVATQVFLAGLAVFVTPVHWAQHTSFVHIFEFVPLIMLILSVVGRLPARLRWMSGGLFLLTYAQYFTANIRGQLPYVSALHPVVALLIFWLSLRAVQEARRHRSEVQRTTA